MSEAELWRDTPPCAADRGAEHGSGLYCCGGRRLLLIDGIDVRLAHQLPGYVGNY